MLVDPFGIFLFVMEKVVKMPKKTILTRELQAQHLFAGQNT